MNNKAAMLGLAVLAFLVAAVLVIMIFRMLFGGRLRMPGGRSRQARLGIVDAFDLDRQRQLIIVRRDNVEHLIMIGGPNDVVIEAEIIRAEARDVRDTRREPGMVAGFSDGGRIPAPMAAIDKPEFGSPAEPPPPADQPPLPLPLPAAASGQPDPASPPRGPTFPLPRRQTQPERPPAAPPRLPEAVSRGDHVPSRPSQPPSSQPPTQAPTPPRPVPPPSSARPASPAPPAPVVPAPSSTVPPPAGSPAAPQPPRPPFLKPPPPRPPFRPLQRATPQQPGTTAPSGAPPAAAPAASGQAPAPRPPSGPAPSAPPAARPNQPPVPASSAGAPKPAGSDDALESLEEEMAKLLGRGS